MWQDEQTAVTDMNVVTTAHPHTGRLYVYANPFIRLVRLEGGLEYLRGGGGWSTQRRILREVGALEGGGPENCKYECPILA